MMDDDELSSPLDAGAASLPPTLGEGCLSRFDPAALTEEMGVDFGEPSSPEEAD